MNHVLPRTVEEVFSDFKGRRAGLMKALTIDVEKFYKECDPGKDNLCLYGLPNGTWEVNFPVEEVPPELPEPALGINFARDGLQDKDWLSLVAVHSDSWLLSVAFYFGGRFGFDKNMRAKLFHEINQLPTLFEIVSGKAKQPKVNTGLSCDAILQSKGVEENALPEEDDDSGEEKEVDEENEDEDEQLCGDCGDAYVEGEFWIFCEFCKKWFHGDCVDVTEEKAEHIKHYKCPTCINYKKARF